MESTHHQRGKPQEQRQVDGHHQNLDCIVDRHQWFLAKGNDMADHYAKLAKCLWHMPDFKLLEEQQERAKRAKNLLLCMARVLARFPAQVKRNSSGKKPTNSYVGVERLGLNNHNHDYELGAISSQQRGTKQSEHALRGSAEAPDADAHAWVHDNGRLRCEVCFAF